MSDVREQRRLGRIVSNEVNERSRLGPSLGDGTSKADQRLLQGRAAVLAPVDERDLRFRLPVMVTVLIGLSGPAFAPLRDVGTTRRLTRACSTSWEATVRTEPTPT